jgi:hypothetical protein
VPEAVHYVSGIFKSRSLRWAGHAARPDIQEKLGKLRRRNISENVHFEDQEYVGFLKSFKHCYQYRSVQNM